jgi:hypothetical protein
VTKRKPLAVLVDTDTVDESAVMHLRQEMEDLLRAVAGGVPFKVFTMVPEIEALLFRVPAALERVTQQKLSADNMALSRYQPRQAIIQLSQNKRAILDQILNELTPEELNVLRETSPIKELIEFLTQHIVRKQQPQTA